MSDVQPSIPPAVQLWQMASAHWMARAIHVAAQIGVADYLTGGPQRIDKLARETGTHEPSLYRLLRALSSVGIFKESHDRTFALTPLGEPLVSNAPNSIRSGPVFLGERFHWEAWGSLLHSIKTGEPTFHHVFGQDMFAYLAEHPDEAVPFNGWMSQNTALHVRAILSAYDFSAFKTIADIGGGQGQMLAAILAQNPDANGILFDAPPVVANEILKNHPGLSSRYRTVAGDFFESVPAGADLYLMKQVVHDWNDDLASRILVNCQKAMGPKSRLILVEMVIPDERNPHPGFFIDLNMMVLTSGGLERTEAEYKRLLDSAGLSLTRVIPTASPFSLVEAVRK